MGKLKRYFPIETATSCRLKWAWSSIWLNTGTTGSCCFASIGPIGDDFDNFHNTEKKIESRKLMLQGQWPKDGCDTCERIEATGGLSDRQFQNSIPEIYPEVLDTDPNAVIIDPVVLEIYFSNTCNLKCVYCDASFSSAIQAEDTKFGGPLILENKFPRDNNQYRDLVPKFRQWFETNGTKLKRLQVLGGEPFLQKDVKELNDHFKTHAYPELEYNIITNLNVDTALVEKQIEGLSICLAERKIKRVDIQASIDCWGPEQEYVRNGIDINLFDANMKNMLTHRGIRVGLLSTVTSLSINTMHQLLDKWKDWNQLRKVFWYMHLVKPSDGIFSPLIFRYELFEQSLKYLLDNLPDVTWDNQMTKDTLLGIVRCMEKECTNNIKKQQELYEFLEANDNRRNSNWRETFPWLLKELEHNNVV